jgi:hypothetical protein
LVTATGNGSTPFNGEVNAQFDGSQLTLLDGTTSAPAYSFNNDRDTGFLSRAANSISLALGGNEEFRWLLNGSDGEFHATGDVVAFSTTPSDERLKENVQDVENPIETIQKLRGVTFDWKYNNRGSDIGFIAQEVEKVLPQIVREKNLMKSPDENETYKVVAYDRLIPILVESIKVLTARIDELEKRQK